MAKSTAKTAAKKASPKVKAVAKPLWAWAEKGADFYDTYSTRDAAVAAAKDHVQEMYSASWSKPSKPPIIQIFQQVETVQFNVVVEEIPVTSFKTQVTVQ